MENSGVFLKLSPLPKWKSSRGGRGSLGLGETGCNPDPHSVTYWAGDLCQGLPLSEPQFLDIIQG